MSDYLLPEILVEIFLKLPIETLVRCTSICKLWNSIITSQSFSALHLKHSLLSNKNRKNPLLVRRSPVSKMETLSVYHFNENQSALMEQAKFQFPFAAQDRWCSWVSCPINGVLLLCRGEKYVLFNPSIRKHLILPSPSFHFDRHVIGFGYAGQTHDYKVVRIVYQKPEFPFTYYTPDVVQVYSLNSRAWHDVKYADPCCYLSESSGAQTFMNGFIHWIANDRVGDGGSSRFLLVFNLDDETFSNMKMPQSCAVSRGDVSVENLGGCLSLGQFDRNRYACCSTIWVMKEYGAAESWTKLYTIKQEATDRVSQMFMSRDTVVGMLKKNELLIRKHWCLGFKQSISRLVLYNPETEQSIDLGVSGIADSQNVVADVECLALIAGASTFQSGDGDQPSVDPIQEHSGDGKSWQPYHHIVKCDFVRD